MSKKHVSTGKQKPSDKKRALSTEDAESYYKKYPSWRFHRCDKNHDRWHINEDNYGEVISILQSFETMTWAEILAASGGKAKGHGNMSHQENVADFIKEAQDRLQEIRLDEYDVLFSLRKSGKERIYGIMDNGVLDLVWFDRLHEIYSTKN